MRRCTQLDRSNNVAAPVLNRVVLRVARHHDHSDRGARAARTSSATAIIGPRRVFRERLPRRAELETPMPPRTSGADPAWAA